MGLDQPGEASSTLRSVIEVACSCDQWPGPHSHIAPRVRVHLPSGKEPVLPAEVLDLNPQAHYEILERIPEEVRPWVDWKQVAHDQMVNPD